MARLPVANAFDWTAAPSSPVTGSLATIENVPSIASCARSGPKAANIAIAKAVLIMTFSRYVVARSVLPDLAKHHNSESVPPVAVGDSGAQLR
jgi:hypothetical protein